MLLSVYMRILYLFYSDYYFSIVKLNESVNYTVKNGV